MTVHHHRRRASRPDRCKSSGLGAGLDILLVDRRLTYGGGGLCTREVTLPGFYHNLHSINHFHISETPPGSRIRIWTSASPTSRPASEFGQAHHDGSALVLGRDLEESASPTLPVSRRKMRRLSANGTRKAEKITAQIFLPERYSDPLSKTEREALSSHTALGRELLEVSNRQPLDVVRELFENEHVQLAVFVQGISVWHLAGGYLSKTSAYGLGYSRLRSGKRLPASCA